MQNDLRILGRLFWLQRHVLGLSCRQVAAAAGTSRASLVRLETGMGNPRASLLVAVAAALEKLQAKPYPC